MKNQTKTTNSLKKEYRDLEQKVIRQLRDLVEASNLKSLPVTLGDYKELAIIDDTLCFIGLDNQIYSYWIDTKLEDLIDIIEAN